MKEKERKFQFKGNIATRILYKPIFFFFYIIGGMAELRSKSLTKDRGNSTNMFD